jgi:predicted dehydrogenase
VSGVVVGYGSVGHHHAQVLAKRYPKLAIVDAGGVARKRAAEDHPAATVAASLRELAATGWEHERSLAVIATWGPSHSEVFAELVELGVRWVLCEKPMASSVADGAAMVRRAEEAGVRLGVHLQRRYSGVIEGLWQLADEHALGPVAGVVLHGGARCLVTNGIHYLDMVSGLLRSSPSRVTATAVGDPINPRSPDLSFYGGTAVWTYPGGQELVMALNNASSVAERMHLYHRDGVIDLSPAGWAQVRLRRAEDVARFPSITRTGPADVVVHDGPVPGLLDPPDPTVRLLDELEGGGPQRLTPEEALAAVEACVGALAAGQSGAAVTLPLDRDGASWRATWPMS